AVARGSPVGWAWLQSRAMLRRVRRFAHPPRTAFDGTARRIGVPDVAIGLALLLVACRDDPEAASSLEARARSQSARQTSQTEAPGDATPPAASASGAPSDADGKASATTPPATTPPDSAG